MYLYVFKQQMLYLKKLTESQIAQKWPKIHPGALKILTFSGEAPQTPQEEGHSPPTWHCMQRWQL